MEFEAALVSFSKSKKEEKGREEEKGGKGRREKEQAREGKKKRNYLPADLIIHLFFSVIQHYNKHPGFLPVLLIFRLGAGEVGSETCFTPPWKRTRA